METTEFRVIGPPGTGKTTYLSRQVERVIAQDGSDAVMVASLTRAAAAEVAGRNLPVHPQQIGTLHSHAYHTLDHPEIADSPERLEVWNAYITDQGKPYYQITTGGQDLDEAKEGAIQTGETKGDSYFQQYQQYRARMQPEEVWTESVLRFARYWEDWKADTGYLDFTDLIESAYHHSTRAPGNPSAIFLDEAQDMDRLEMSLARKWGQHAEHFIIVGDPDQNLYQWRGSDPEVFTTPEIPEERYRVLTQSYRVPEAVHAYAVRWIQQIPDRPPVEYHPRDALGAIQRMHSGSWQHPDPLLTKAQEYTAEGKTVMFLTSCSYMLEPLKAVLRRQGIPFHNPYRRKRGDWNPLQTSGTSMAERLEAFLYPKYAEEDRWWRLHELADWIPLLKSQGTLQRGVKTEIQTMVEKHDVRDVLPWDVVRRFFRDDVDLTPLQHFDLAWLESRMLARKRKRAAFPLRILKQRGFHALREQPKIIIGTGHSVKGGQADVVFVFPDLSRAFMRDYHRSQTGRNALIRLFYVMLTRAREEVVLCQNAGALRMQWLPISGNGREK